MPAPNPAGKKTLRREARTAAARERDAAAAEQRRREWEAQRRERLAREQAAREQLARNPRTDLSASLPLVLSAASLGRLRRWPF